jgi:predicted glycosyltransferase
MKILIDIGHPAHVHYFKNFIWLMQDKGHSISIISRDKEVALDLLNYYKFPYYNRGKGKNSSLGKILYLFQGDFFLLKKALKIKPDMYLSAGSSYAAHVAWLTRKPHIALDDTDHNTFQQLMYVPFTKVVLTPKVFQKDFGTKQIRFNAFLELCSLHPNHFKSETKAISNIADESNNDRYVILRFVSWNASHDIGLKGLSLDDKYQLVRELSKHARVIISSESDLPENLKQYAYSVHPALMHDLLAGASLLVSESLTMSAEAAFLGTPTLCISTAKAGTLDEEVRLGLIELYRSSNGIVERAIELIKNKEYKSTFKLKSSTIVKNMTDLTSFLVWFVENFPGSFSKMKKEPDYELNFK